MKARIFYLLLAVCSTAVFAYAQDSQPQAKSYLLGPGDEISVKVVGDDQWNFVATVDENGNIGVPFVDKTISAKCRSDQNVRDDVTQALKKYLKNPLVSVRITERKSRPAASVFGEVKLPQQYSMSRQYRLLELISFSGGVTEKSNGTIKVTHTQAPMCPASDDEFAKNFEKENAEVPFRLYSYNSLDSGNPNSNPNVYPGDVIEVLKALPIYVTGEVLAPREILLPPGGLPLSQAIAMSLGASREAKKKDVRIYRLKDGKLNKEPLTANLELIKKGLQNDIMLEPYDIVEVDKTPKTFWDNVKDILGGAARAASQTLPVRVI